MYKRQVICLWWALFHIRLARGVDGDIGVVQASQAQREEILAGLTKLMSTKLRTSRRIEVVLFLSRVLQHLLSGRTTAASAIPQSTLGSWMHGLPEVVWTLGVKHGHVACAALTLLRRGALETMHDGRTLLQELEPMLVANFGVITTGKRGKGAQVTAGPLPSMEPAAQVCPFLVWTHVISALHLEEGILRICTASGHSVPFLTRGPSGE